MVRKIRNNPALFRLLDVQLLSSVSQNALKVFLLILGVNLLSVDSAGGQDAIYYGLLFLLPFILIAPLSGRLTDTVGVRKVIIVSSFIQLLISLLVIGLVNSSATENLPLVFVLLGFKSAIFTPAKYAYLPVVLTRSELSLGNGYLELRKNVGIVIGTIIGALFVHHLPQYLSVGLGVLGVLSVLNCLLSFLIPDVREEVSANKQKQSYLSLVKEICGNSQLVFSAFLISFFLLFGIILVINTIYFAQQEWGLTRFELNAILALMYLGLAEGVMCAGRWSENKIELGLIPFATIMMCALCLLLALVPVSMFLGAFSFLLMGFFGGLYIVPIYAYLQDSSPNGKRGSYIGVITQITVFVMVIGVSLFGLFKQSWFLRADLIFLGLGIVSFGVAFFIFKSLPVSFIRFASWVLVHTIYRVTIIGREHVPWKGGALLVCNKVFFSAFPILVGSLHRMPRFIVHNDLYQNAVFKPFWEMLKAIPLSKDNSPEEIEKVLSFARSEIEAGHVVAIFVENVRSPLGSTVLSFSQAFESIAHELEAPIIPMYLDQMWGSLITYEGDRLFWKAPKRIPYPVTLLFGEPVGEDMKGSDVRIRVQELGVDALYQRKRFQRRLGHFFIHETKRPFLIGPWKFCIGDRHNARLSYGTILARSLYFSISVIQGLKQFQNEERIGIMLPAGANAAIVTWACLFAGKVPVHLNFTATKKTVDAQIKQAKIQSIITTESLLEERSIKKQDSMSFYEDCLKHVTPTDRLWAYLSAFFLPAWLVAHLSTNKDPYSVDELATIIFAPSKEEGVVKGVCLSHRNVFTNIEGLFKALRLRPGRKVLGVLPFFHSFGFTGTLCFPMATGLGVVYQDNPLAADEVARLIRLYKIRVLMGNENFLSAYAHKCDPTDFKSVRYVIPGAERFKHDVARLYYKKFKITPFEGYGAPELSPLVSIGISTEEDIPEEGQQKQFEFSHWKMGYPIPGVVVKVVNKETNKQLLENEDGHVLVKGTNVMMGYLKSTPETAEKFKDGWFDTGAVGHLDENGVLHLRNVMTQSSVIQGVVVPHIEVKNAILNCIENKDQGLVVLSLADSQTGEKLVVLYDGQIQIDTLQEELYKQNIPAIWVPAAECFYHVDKLPRLDSGLYDMVQLKRIAKGMDDEYEEGADFETAMVKTSDGVGIALNHYKRGHKEVVILAHGFHNAKDAPLFRLNSAMFAREFDAICFDFRGHGKSEGAFTFTSNEEKDLIAVIDYAKECGYEKVGLIGFSLGAALVILVGSHYPNIDSIIAVSAPYDFWKIDYHFWEREMWNDLYHIIGPKGKGRGIRPGNLFLAKKRPIDVVADVSPTPLLLLHGADDWLIKPEHSERLFKEAQEPKRMTVIDSAGHADIIFDDFPDEYKRVCLDWFQETLK